MSRDLMDICIKRNETDEKGRVVVDGRFEQRLFVNQKPHLPHEYTVDDMRCYVYRTNGGEIIVAGVQVSRDVAFIREFGDVYTTVRVPQRHERQMIKEYLQEQTGYSNIKFLLD